MFNNLIESERHIKDMKRRGSFIFATIMVYGLLIAVAGVGSIYAYEAHVDNQTLELTALVTMLPTAPAPPQHTTEPSDRRQSRSAVPTDSNAQVPMRTVRMSDVTDMRKVSDQIGIKGDNIPPAPPNAEIGPRNYNVGGTDSDGNSPYGSDRGTRNATTDGSGDSGLTKDTPPEIPPRVETKPAKPKIISLGVIESKVLHKAVPPYPELAKKARVSGLVTVEILLDVDGRVISAHATNGHPLLRAASEQAAYQTRFTPTLLSNQPVKVSGMITFKFVLQ